MNRAVLFLEPKGTALKVVQEAKRRGYTTLAFTSENGFLEGSAGSYRSLLSSIDKIHLVEDWSQTEKVVRTCLEAGRAFDVRGVFTATDPCVVASAHLREKFELPSTSPRVYETILNKFELRTLLREKGLSRLKAYRSVEGTWPFQGAAYFKPIHGLASAYVRRCKTVADLEQAVAEYRTGNSTDPKILKDYVRGESGTMVEEEFKGELMSVEALCSNGDFYPLGVLSRILLSTDEVVEMGSCFPYSHPREKEIIEFVRRAHEAIGFTDGASHTEVIVGPDGRIEVIDLNPRFVGADVMQSINRAFDIEIEKSLLDLALGERPSLDLRAKKTCCLQYVIAPAVDRFESLDFPKDPAVEFTSTFLKPGDRVVSASRQLDYAGCYLTVGSDLKSALAKSRQLRSHVKINRSLPGVF